MSAVGFFKEANIWTSHPISAQTKKQPFPLDWQAPPFRMAQVGSRTGPGPMDDARRFEGLAQGRASFWEGCSMAGPLRTLIVLYFNRSINAWSKPEIPILHFLFSKVRPSVMHPQGVQAWQLNHAFLEWSLATGPAVWSFNWRVKCKITCAQML